MLFVFPGKLGLERPRFKTRVLFFPLRSACQRCGFETLEALRGGSLSVLRRRERRDCKLGGQNEKAV